MGDERCGGVGQAARLCDEENHPGVPAAARPPAGGPRVVTAVGPVVHLYVLLTKPSAQTSIQAMQLKNIRHPNLPGSHKPCDRVCELVGRDNAQRAGTLQGIYCMDTNGYSTPVLILNDSIEQRAPPLESSRASKSDSEAQPAQHDLLEVNEYLVSGLVVSSIDKWFMGPVPQFSAAELGLPMAEDLSASVQVVRKTLDDPEGLSWPPVSTDPIVHKRSADGTLAPEHAVRAPA